MHTIAYFILYSSRFPSIFFNFPSLFSVFLRSERFFLMIFRFLRPFYSIFFSFFTSDFKISCSFSFDLFAFSSDIFNFSFVFSFNRFIFRFPSNFKLIGGFPGCKILTLKIKSEDLYSTLLYSAHSSLCWVTGRSVGTGDPFYCVRQWLLCTYLRRDFWAEFCWIFM